MTDYAAEFIPWDEVNEMVSEAVEEYRKIRSGIHISMLATNRGGKTTLATGGGNKGHGILSHFENVLLLDTTADPGPISDYGKPVSRFRAIRGHQRLTVNNMRPESREKVAKWIRRALKQGNVCIYADEIRQVTDKKYFGLGPLFDHIWLFEAKKGNSLVGGTQAPLWVPGAFYDQAKLHFLFHIRDERRMKRLSEIGGDTATLRAILPDLQRYEFAFVDLDGEVWRSKFELPKKVEKSDSGREVTLTRSPETRKLRVSRGRASGRFYVNP